MYAPLATAPVLPASAVPTGAGRFDQFIVLSPHVVEVEKILGPAIDPSVTHVRTLALTILRVPATSKRKNDCFTAGSELDAPSVESVVEVPKFELGLPEVTYVSAV